MTSKTPLPVLLKQPTIIALGLVLSLLLASTIYYGEQLKTQAKRHWQNQASHDAEAITNNALHGAGLFHSQLRGLAALFYGSSHVSKNEFLDAISVLEDIDVASPLGAWGLIEITKPDDPQKGEQHNILYSTENVGILSEGTNVSGQAEIDATIARTFTHPGNVITGNAFIGPNGHRQVLFGISVPHNGQDAVLFSSLNLDYFFKDLKALHIPAGLNLRLSEAQLGQDDLDEGLPIFGRMVELDSPVLTLNFHTETGSIQWKFHWDVLAHYLGGPATGLGTVIQGSGLVIGALFFGLLILFSRESRRVNWLVQERTAELNWALEAAEKANNMLKDLSLRDGLTSIPNRRRFDEFLDREWKSAIRHKGELSIILIDIDFFKLYNDTLGHTEGDECLKKIAFILQGRIERATDLIARYGGEEFICVLPQTSLDGAVVIGNKLRQAIADANIPHPDSQAASYVTISLGVATLIPNSGQFPTKLINIADENLYKAKESGRNRLVS